MSAYDVDPAIIAYADQHMSAVGADLSVLIQSYLTHRGQTDPTIAFVVLCDDELCLCDCHARQVWDPWNETWRFPALSSTPTQADRKS